MPVQRHLPGIGSRQEQQAIDSRRHLLILGLDLFQHLPVVLWLLELRQVLAQIEARDSTLRGPTVALACAFALVGLASVSAVWIVLAVLAGLQAPIIMMSQNRQSEKDRLRSDLDYRVNLKNELSLIEVLRRLDVLESERLPKLFEEENRQLKHLVAELTLDVRALRGVLAKKI